MDRIVGHTLGNVTCLHWSTSPEETSFISHEHADRIAFELPINHCSLFHQLILHQRYHVRSKGGSRAALMRKITGARIEILDLLHWCVRSNLSVFRSMRVCSGWYHRCQRWVAGIVPFRQQQSHSFCSIVIKKTVRS